MTVHRTARRLAVVLFDGFELLDVFGPLELFGMLPDDLFVALLGPDAEPVRSAQGPRVLVDHAYVDALAADIVLVPGGMGTRRLVDDAGFCEWLGGFASKATLVTSVCTGAAVLAAAGLLDGHRATTNKRAFEWVTGHGRNVEWVAEARWVEDGDRWTSSGVSAGMDMAVALIARLFGEEAANSAAMSAEFEPHRDPSWDPFAAFHGLAKG